MRGHRRTHAQRRLSFPLAMLVLTLLAGGVLAQQEQDDRQLFQASNSKPYVFFLVDISSSMHQSNGSEPRPPMSGDDPASRLYQAKRAVYEVIDEVGDDIAYGWATFDRDHMHVRRKHWLYKLNQVPPWPSEPGGRVMDVGQLVLFGAPVSINTDLNGQDEIVETVFNDNRLEIDTANKIYKFGICRNGIDRITTDRTVFRDFPKLGDDGTWRTEILLERGSRVMRFIFEPLGVAGTSSEPGAVPTMKVRVHAQQRTSTNCSQPDTYTSYSGSPAILEFHPYYDQDDESIPGSPLDFVPDASYISWEQSGGRSFSMRDYGVNEACAAGIDTNKDGSTNPAGEGDEDPLSYDFVADPFGRGQAFDRGDLIPWDWVDNRLPTAEGDPPLFRVSNQQEILWRLAPNTRVYPDEAPDFRIARYFQNVPQGEDVDGNGSIDRIGLVLKPEFEDYPPIQASRGTPLAKAMSTFGAWYQEWKAVAAHSSPDIGDPSYDCRSQFVILLTDGQESCNGKPGMAAGQLLQLGIRTFVITFGTGSANFDDIANRGGTGLNPIPPNAPRGPGPLNADDVETLKANLIQVIDTTIAEARSIAAAAVPSVQSDVADKIFLSQFRPADDRSVWPGSIQAYVKPVPLGSDGKPDENIVCDAPDDTGCLAWDVQDAVYEDQTSGDPGNPSTPLARPAIGNAANQRRIYYSILPSNDVVPQARQFFQATTGSTPFSVKLDLWRGFGFNLFDFSVESKANQLLKTAVARKRIDYPDGSREDFVLGDFFHSDPLILGAPSDSTYFVQDVGGDANVDCQSGGSITLPDGTVVQRSGFEEQRLSYRCFSLRHRFRRKVLFIGSNDGMLHAFEAGVFHDPNGNGNLNRDDGDEFFDNGTGHELFAFVPRPVMPSVKDLYFDHQTRHEYTVDGPPIAADVFIDTRHSGPGSGLDPVSGADDNLAPNAEDRGWRTVLVGGLRRGGGDLDQLVDPIDPDPDEDADETEEIPSGQIASGYYALDVTEPDPVLAIDRNSNGDPDFWIPSSSEVPGCLGDGDGTGMHVDCGKIGTQKMPSTVPWGAPLWEFFDVMNGSTANDVHVSGLRLDEDDNRYIDLAPTWSPVVIGRIEVCTGTNCDTTVSRDDALAADIEDRYVAVFGGGYDSKNKHVRGNWLYMVDVETGKTLYKQPLLGAAAARPSVLNTPSGYFDRIYIGTTLGFLYRLDLRPLIGGELVLPPVEPTTIHEHVAGLPLNNPVLSTEERIQTVDVGAGRDLFVPVPIFTTNDPGADVEAFPELAKSIFLPASIFFVGERSSYALAIGTGNRDNIFKVEDNPRGRFVVFVDDFTSENLVDLSFTTLNVSSTGMSDLTDANNAALRSDNFLLPPSRGWYLDLGLTERLTGRPIVLAGLVFFSTFKPADTEINDLDLCTSSGTSQIYGVLATSANPILPCDDDESDRCRNVGVDGLATAPFVEHSSTKNKPPNPDGDGGGGDDDDDDDEEEDENLKCDSDLATQITNELKAYFPDNCAFPPSMTQDVTVRKENTGLECIVELPTCVIETLFREF